MNNAGNGVIQDPKVIEASLKEILSERQFSHLNPRETGGDFPQTIMKFIQKIFDLPWMKSIRNFIEKLLEPLLDYLNRFTKNIWGEHMFYISIGLCTLLMLILILQIYRILKKNVVTEISKQVPEKSSGGRLNISSAEEQATKCADNLDYLGAIQNLYRAMLILIDEKRLIRFNPALTNIEIEAILKDNSRDAVLELFHKCNMQFEDKFYARKTATSQDFEQFKENYLFLKKEL